ncbi:MAG: Maf family protein, partial [Erysipelotrichaceae bacterium]|nr:Maf family protein [Erysipelotrichaceae bacterium]
RLYTEKPDGELRRAAQTTIYKILDAMARLVSPILVYTSDEIWQYIKSGEPMDKAGSYGIQGLGAKYIDFIEGDFYSIMGLPISQLYTKLKEYLPL